MISKGVAHLGQGLTLRSFVDSQKKRRKGEDASLAFILVVYYIPNQFPFSPLCQEKKKKIMTRPTVSFTFSRVKKKRKRAFWLPGLGRLMNRVSARPYNKRSLRYFHCNFLFIEEKKENFGNDFKFGALCLLWNKEKANDCRKKTNESG